MEQPQTIDYHVLKSQVDWRSESGVFKPRKKKFQNSWFSFVTWPYQWIECISIVKEGESLGKNSWHILKGCSGGKKRENDYDPIIWSLNHHGCKQLRNKLSHQMTILIRFLPLCRPVQYILCLLKGASRFLKVLYIQMTFPEHSLREKTTFEIEITVENWLTL